VAADLDHRPHHQQAGSLEVDRVEPEPGRLTPAQPGAGRDGNDPAVPWRDGGQ
jgi:hypothetical protein